MSEGKAQFWSLLKVEVVREMRKEKEDTLVCDITAKVEEKI